MLYEVALGLQYLHERGVVHWNLMGEHLLVGEDGKAKLAGFGLMHSKFARNQPDEDATYDHSSVHKYPFVWDSWEVVRGSEKTVESDMYSLGMCILEAVSGAVPYAAEIEAGCDLKNLICWGVLPEHPPGMSDRAWALVTQLTKYEYVDRLKIAEAVRELAALAGEEREDALPAVPRGVSNRPDENVDLMAEVERVEELLAIVWSLIGDEDEAHQSWTPQQQVFQRLHDISSTLDGVNEECLATVLPPLTVIITRFTNDLQARAGMSDAASFASERQRASRIFSLHTDIDRVVEPLVSAQLTLDGSIHAWRDNWHAPDAAASLQDACETLRSKPGVRVPDWFIPHYEVAFDEFRSFSRGAFGSVHHGEWMGSRAVIKKVFSTNQENDHGDSEFTKEVELWSQLYHPHVLQLFGACHVGQKFLVSEFAGKGQLDVYLRKFGRRRRREVWRLLYEAGLGLQYLHARGIVHCDLKCNNILVGLDGEAKLSDYGLSRKKVPRDSSTVSKIVGSAAPEPIGAPRWKAPEVLNGADPTFESDVYGFAMCVVEAVTGDYPWGSRDRDELVSDHVRRGKGLFSKPHQFSDAQWALVVGACRFDPDGRLQLHEVVKLLKTFADASKSDETLEEDATELEDLLFLYSIGLF